MSQFRPSPPMGRTFKILSIFLMLLSLLWLPTPELFADVEPCQNMLMQHAQDTTSTTVNKADCLMQVVENDALSCDSCSFNASGIIETQIFMALPLSSMHFLPLAPRFIASLNSPPLLPPPVVV